MLDWLIGNPHSGFYDASMKILRDYSVTAPTMELQNP
jgi:hypothetical protein